MRRRTRSSWHRMVPALVLALALPACEGTSGPQGMGGSGGVTGGTPSAGGQPAKGGASAAGGDFATGGVSATGGDSATGGRATGGISATGGTPSTGGATGGTPSTGGTMSSGGTTRDAGVAPPDARPDLGARDTLIVDARPRDTAPDLARDSAIARDTQAGGVIDPVTGFAKCPVNSGTTPLPAPGAITWTLAKSSTPTAAEQAAYDRIIPAMNTAVCIYSAYTNLKKQINVAYNAGVPTAEGSTNGASATSDIRFGSTASMNYITAMHEMSHNFGIGSTAFNNLCVNGVFGGANATAELRAITGVSTDAVKCGGSHFWPYGLNYTTEWKDDSEGKNHCRMVLAIRKDLGL